MFTQPVFLSDVPKQLKWFSPLWIPIFGCSGFTLGLIFYYVLFAIKHSDQTLLGPSAPESRTRFTAQVIFNMSVYLGYCKCAKNDKYFPNDFCYFCLVLCLVFVLNNCIKPFISALYTVTKKSEFRIDWNYLQSIFVTLKRWRWVLAI